jgi:cytochrome c biogenesis protein CcmG, thiol:disulfide interchange protein DsbE
MQVADPRSAHSTLSALGVVSALLVGIAVLPRLFSAHPSAAIGREAPDLDLAVVANGALLGSNDAHEMKLSRLRGHAVVLDFWATWCQPCRLEAPIVDQVARRWRDQGVVVVGVDMDTPDQGDPRAFALETGLSYPIVRDTTGAAARAYDVDGLPTLVVISREGRITAVRSGVTDRAELDRLVRQAM